MKFTVSTMKIPEHKCEMDIPAKDTSEAAIDDDEEDEEDDNKLGFFISLILVSDYNRLARKLFPSSFARHLEKERQYTSKYWYIIHPFSLLRTFWQFVMVGVLFLSFILIPYSHTFHMVGSDEKENTIKRWKYLTFVLVLDIICLVDILMNFLTGYYREINREVVLDQLLIIRRYVKWWFWVDLISSIPFDFIFYQLFTPEELDYDSMATLLAFAFASIKIFRLVTFLEHLDHLCMLCGIQLLPARIIRLVFISLILTHCTACMSYFLPYAIYGRAVTNMDSPDYVTHYQYLWINQQGVFHMTTLRKYKFAMLRAAAQFGFIGECIAYPGVATADIVEELVRIVQAIFFNVYLLSNIVHWSLSHYRPQSKYLEIMNQVTHFMFHNRLPKRTINRIVVFYEYRFQRRFFREHHIEKALSLTLRREIQMYCARRLVDSAEIFREMPRVVQTLIVTSLHQVVFLEEDVIIQAGTIGDCMYFLASGSVTVTLPSGREVCHLVDGAHFGEMSLLSDDKIRTATIIALETTECYRLERADFKRYVTTQLLDTFEHVAYERQKMARTVDMAFVNNVY